MSTGLVTDGRGDGSASMVPTIHTVVHRRVEIPSRPAEGIDEVVTLELEAQDRATPVVLPGQFSMLWAPGVGEVPISVSSAGPRRLGFTIRSVGATTAALCAAPIGASIGVRGPFGRGWSLPDGGRRTVVVAGGIGLAPLRMHIEALLESRADRLDPLVVLVIGARTPAEILYPELIDAWSESCEVHLTVDRARPGWHGEVGLVTSTLSRLAHHEGVAASLCGPEIMMRLAAADLVTAGADPGSVEVSLERSMACALAHCGRCQLGPVMLCRDGPVSAWPEARALMEVRRW